MGLTTEDRYLSLLIFKTLKVLHLPKESHVQRQIAQHVNISMNSDNSMIK